MSKLDEAMSEFAAALDRLDGALGGQSVQIEARAELENQIAALKEDRARLAEEIDVMRADVNRLESLNARASAEIGTALKDINRLLS
ncbi:MAG: DUF4164 family protein [Parvibaculaceae bacterium]